MRLIRHRHRRQAHTLIELMFAVLVGVLASSMAIYLMLFVARSQDVLTPQLARQTSVSRALQRSSDLLRNAEQSSVVYFSGGSVVTLGAADRIDFQHVAMPAGQLSSLRFENDDLIYFPDTSSSSGAHVLATNLEDLEFRAQGSMIQITAEFLYRKYRGYDASDNERMNGTMVTQVFPRN